MRRVAASISKTPLLSSHPTLEPRTCKPPKCPLFPPAKTNRSDRPARPGVQAQVLPALKELFRPELLNRIDEVVVFHALEPEHLRDIVDLMVAKTRQRLVEQSIT